MDTLDMMIAWENGELDEESYIALFQALINNGVDASGLLWQAGNGHDRGWSMFPRCSIRQGGYMRKFAQVVCFPFVFVVWFFIRGSQWAWDSLDMTAATVVIAEAPKKIVYKVRVLNINRYPTTGIGCSELISAVKMLRAKNGWGLGEAKRVCDNATATTPQTALRTHDSLDAETFFDELCRHCPNSEFDIVKEETI